MTDVFLSYSSKDRDRVRPIFEALAAAGFDVFWDLETPAGVLWEKWIVGHLTQAKCVVVCWSRNASDSDNVKYEARVANEHGKLIPLMLEPLKTDQFPMGLDAIQAPNLAGWRGEVSDARWQRIQKKSRSRSHHSGQSVQFTDWKRDCWPRGSAGRAPKATKQPCTVRWRKRFKSERRSSARETMPASKSARSLKTCAFTEKH
jgi:hypothetical protein